MSWIEDIVRPDILALKAHEHAPWHPAFTRLHANEWPQRLVNDESEAGLNRYPEPQPRALVARLALLYEVPEDRILLGRGSDELIDLLVRAFCQPAEDAIIVCPPTFGMYALAARIQGAKVIDVPLNRYDAFDLNPGLILRESATASVKIVFLCSPNNPTGNLLGEAAIVEVLEGLRDEALVVLDEAYLEFSDRSSLAKKLNEYPHLAVLRSLSKAHGLAGARVGALLADPAVIAIVGKLIAPYAIPQLTLEAVLALLSPSHLRSQSGRMRAARQERERFCKLLASLPEAIEVFPSDANFVLARFTDPAQLLSLAHHAKLLVRDARGYVNLPDALRITIGTPEQNDRLIAAWS
jgi:histidinol-phosphate aminotransferase